ncbi:MAG: TIGR00266 family protein [Acidobacteriota bacterium]
MDVSIDHQPSYALAVVSLSEGETIQAESGAMVSMSSTIQVETGMKGGLLQSVTRKLFGGESLFTNTFTAIGSAGELTLAPSLPGDITSVSLSGETMYIQSGSFLAGDPGIELDLKWGGARTFFGSEGLFLLRASGNGPLLVSSYGAIHRVQVTPSAPYICDTGHIVAFTQGLDFNIRKVGGLKATLLSGEGLVCNFQGQGTLYLQTRSTQAFLSWLIPRLPTGTGGGGGRRGGVWGNLLGGR